MLVLDLSKHSLDWEDHHDLPNQPCPQSNFKNSENMHWGRGYYR